MGLTVLVALILCSLYFAFLQRDYLYGAFIFLFILICITETALQLQKGIIFFAIFYSMLAFTKRPAIPIAPTFKPRLKLTHSIDDIDLKVHVLKTLLYYDIFNYPLKSEEVFQFLGTNSITEDDVRTTLDALANDVDRLQIRQPLQFTSQ